MTIISLLKKDEDSDRNRTSKKENRSWDYYDFRKFSRFFFFFFWIWRATIKKSRNRENRRKTWERSKRTRNLWKTWEMRRIDRKSQEKKWICEISRFCVERRSFEIVWTKSEENLNLKSFEIWKNKLILLIFMKDLVEIFIRCENCRRKSWHRRVLCEFLRFVLLSYFISAKTISIVFLWLNLQVLRSDFKIFFDMSQSLCSLISISFLIAFFFVDKIINS